MGSLLDLFCNVRLCILDLPYSYLYLHDIYLVVTDIDFMVSLLCYYGLFLVRDLIIVNFYVLYPYVCSSMMSVHPKGGGSMQDTRVMLTNVDIVSGLVKCCCMSPFPTICRGSLHMVTALFSVIVILHVRLGGRRV
jgi:hypothetical protein